MGRPLNSSIGQGALLPRSAVGASQQLGDLREVSVPVDPARLPDVRPGDLVDIYATYHDQAPGQQPGGTVEVVANVVYVGTGGSSASGLLAVLLDVPQQSTAALINASELADLDVVSASVGGGA